MAYHASWPLVFEVTPSAWVGSRIKNTALRLVSHPGEGSHLTDKVSPTPVLQGGGAPNRGGSSVLGLVSSNVPDEYFKALLMVEPSPGTGIVRDSWGRICARVTRCMLGLADVL
jgi:hypothetical protein